MELLKVLEEKISVLMGVINSLKAENARLCKENNDLRATVEQLQVAEKNSLQDKEKLNQENALTKAVVDDLIKNIDALVDNNEVQP